MSMTNPIKGVQTQEIILRNQKGQIIQTKQEKVNKLIYSCRPQVIERRDKWVKFGNVAKIPRGQSIQGQLLIPDTPLVIQDDQGQVDQQIDIAKNLIALSKESMMNKNLKSMR